jgi:hypothetical protein
VQGRPTSRKEIKLSRWRQLPPATPSADLRALRGMSHARPRGSSAPAPGCARSDPLQAIAIATTTSRTPGWLRSWIAQGGPHRGRSPARRHLRRHHRRPQGRPLCVFGNCIHAGQSPPARDPSPVGMIAACAGPLRLPRFLPRLHRAAAAAEPALTLLTHLAVRRYGQAALLRALSRAERAPSAINAL